MSNLDTKSSFQGISIIIPAYNEIQSIEVEVRNVLNVLKKVAMPQEVIVVDDGSTDGTGEALRRIRDIRVLNHQQNRGYGASLKYGIRNAKYDLVGIIDADGTYPKDEIPGMIKKLIAEKSDMVVAARLGADVKIPAIRKPAKKMIGLLANYLTGFRIPDLNSGLRVMRKDIVEKFFNILPSGFSFTTTITLAMLTNDYKVDYISINYNVREGKSKIRPVHDTLNFIMLVFRTVMYFNPLKVFLPMSMGLFLVGFSLLLVRLLVGKILISTTITVFVGAFVILAIGLLADLIDKRMQ
ncbi:MAG: glycosyltransferase family 2 protein [Candidatus Omnitrophica bacterium]|nr:glycosyltransferase family 2 protein [Candidatus Omnitrophota bacterium]